MKFFIKVFNFFSHDNSFPRALAQACDANITKVTHIIGAVAKDWRKSLEIRVVRSSRLESKYAPPLGYRYDGVYKVKYNLVES